MAENQQHETQNLNIMAILPQINKGELVKELTNKLAFLNMDVIAVGKGGKLTLTLDILPSKTADHGVDIVASIGVKAPAVPRKPTVFYISQKDGSMHRNDPNQEELPIGNVAQLKTANSK